MSLALQFLVLGFSALLPLINPIGSAIVVFGIIGPVPDRVMRSLARKIAISSAIFLIVIDIAGAAILRLFGVSLPVVQLAGGLVVAALGWGLLNQREADPATPETAEPEPAVGPNHLDRQVFYPLTFPITAGPGTLVVTLTLSAHAAHDTFKETLFAQLGLIAGMLLLCLAVFIFYALAPRIASKISPSTAHGIARVIAFVVICIGVQIAWNGFTSLAAAHPIIIR